jgi:hypothetical protein
VNLATFLCILAMVALYFAVFAAVGSLAPCLDRICANVTEHVSGTFAGISDGTEKYGEYWPQ